MCELEARNAHTVGDVSAALAEMTEEKRLLLKKVLGEARASHEKEFELYHIQSALLDSKPFLLTQARFEIRCLFRRNGIFDRVRRRLVV
ncbi:hypothetical protein F442_15898 [Phytophthora nicotianae P10297]|uniref:Uncharacterized protein n=5 Tax=Phytophthora nicotianae TaxID=4792 RepID=W2PRS8_PHYN3|nr:hypothetical protein PPTG_15610 [Phytophthora nicotianae INRA-310]ETK78340.1 hypothetical protein L915_15607 [Phytophthora nicotianae]ETP36063.1 hypothetical protein F442_15898 [Phytophthora nicotianae P10297]ETL31772.1 hypothetical protein L916_15502 [Phytophthora nicotianae]ETL85006.1 hypothetical protein L917_15322 [Phytophthora nicotianae]ETN03637.1 hypothetical protein PPTG_15610 [Phytophthora nicotianae INRA-310]